MTRAEILKIAGAKNDKEFYDMFPTEAAFMKKHGKQLKKAQVGIQMTKDGVMGKPFQGMPKKLTQFDIPETLQLNTNVSENPYLYGSMIGGKKKQDFTKIGSTETSGNSVFNKTNLNAGIETLANSADDIITGIQGLEQDKKDIKELRKRAGVSSVVAAAAGSQPEPTKKRYVRPEDALITNPMGRGRRGAGVFQEGGEIQNTYNPGDLYSDLGYEPLNDSNPKQYKKGGKMKKAAAGVDLSGLSSLGGGLGGMLGSKIGGGSGKGRSASQIGSSLGGVAGSFLPIPIPGVGTLLGSTVGGKIGGIFDGGTQRRMKEAEDKLQANLDVATLSNGARSIQMQKKGFMEDGGWVSHDWQPQVIAKFGDYDVDQLLAPPNDADMLRSGGHLAQVNYTPPSARAMYTGRDLPYQMENGGQMAMGGDLEVHRGEAETMSYNPYLPDGGETIMFRGPSHDNGGMPISYGENGVEVEGGEPAIKLQDGGSPDGNLVVYGNMVIPEYGASEIGDSKAKGKKFKHYVADLSKTEAKQNKLIDKTTFMLDDVDDNDPFDQLILNTGQANLIGADMKLKSIADKKKNAATVQNAILDTAEEYGLESDALAKGKMKYAKANDPYAEFGANLEQFKPGGKKGKKSTLITTPSKDISTLPLFVQNIPYKKRAEMAKAMGIPNYRGTADQNTFLFRKQGIGESAPIRKSLQDAILPTKSLTPDLARSAMDKSINAYLKQRPPLETGNEKMNWSDIGNTALAGLMPFIRPTNQVPLDASQLQGEMYALSQNQEEPVYAQSYQPMLTQPISISLQDQLNEITSQARSAERMAQNNPAALAMLASQAAESKNKVLGEQFRMNQAEQQRAMETNRQTLNDAQIKNLSIFDQQQQRAAQARSNTEAQAITALNSISDKIARNKLENRQLAVSENLYNYRFSPKGVAYNVNAPYQFAPYGSGGSGGGQIPAGMIPDYDADETTGKAKVVGYKFPKETKSKERNGSIVKAIKNL